MGVKIAIILFCVAVITECQPQYSFFGPPGFGFQNTDFSFPQPNYSNVKERVTLTRPSSGQKIGSPQNGFVSNQEHYGLSEKKETIKPESQSVEQLNQKFDLDDSKRITNPTDSRKKPVQLANPFNDFQSESKRPEFSNYNQDPYSTGNRRERPSSTVQPNRYQPESLQPGQQQYSSNQNQYSNGNRQERPSSTVQPNRYQPESLQPGQQQYSSNGLNKYSGLQNSYGQRENVDKYEDYKPITEFSWNLFKRVISPEHPNFVMCPLSPQHLLSYLASGAAGETKNEIIRAIKYNSPNQLNSLVTTMLREPGNKEFQLASALFVSNKIGINHSFQKVLADNVKVISTDFSNTEKFNREYSKWVAEKTKGVLANARVKTDPSTKMLMSSAVYFKGEWIFKLNPGGIDDFYVNENTPVKVPMMKLLKKLPYGKLQNGNLGEWIALPYNSNDSMVIILPRKGLPLDRLVESLNVQEVFDQMNNDNYGNVTLTLPKFKIESRASLITALKQMGINQLFSVNAQLPTIFSSNEPISISNVLQQASLEVNEEGSIATSLTAFAVVALSFSPPTPDIEFKVDRPFIAMIIDRKNNFPYFIAKVSNPSI